MERPNRSELAGVIQAYWLIVDGNLVRRLIGPPALWFRGLRCLAWLEAGG